MSSVAICKHYEDGTVLYDIIDNKDIYDAQRMGWTRYNKTTVIPKASSIGCDKVNYHVVQPHMITYPICNGVVVTYIQEGWSL